MGSYQQLAYEKRCQISVLKKRGCSQRDIAESVGVSQSTVSRELARNTGARGYRHNQAQERTIERRREACKATKMTQPMIAVIESKLRIEWSPEQISGWLLVEREELVSHEKIYLHIWSNKRPGGNLYRYLRRQGKKYDTRRNGKSTRDQIKNKISIDERPQVVDDKTRIGNWEIGTVCTYDYSRQW